MILDAIYEVDEQSDCPDNKRVSVNNKPAIFKHKDNVDISQAKKEIEIAKEEWDQVGSTPKAILPVHLQSVPVSCDEVLNYFRSKNMSQYLKCIKPVKQRKGLEALKHWIIGPPKLHSSLVSERNLLFAIAMCPFDTSDEIHMRVLQTLYKSLTGAEKDCPRYGKHWEDVGFQGIDPGTDLRGVGFLGLIHLLSMILNPATAELAKEISTVSKTEKQNFPFCTMGINITRIVLETMREEVLNRECNRKMDVFQVTNDFYAGVFLHLHFIWCEQNKTIMDSGYVIKDLLMKSCSYTELFIYIFRFVLFILLFIFITFHSIRWCDLDH
ncbi:ELMO domain-containing protein 3-like isoform X2 [Stegodyphus dumicola]|uniref:ELMO domain-containing protein 3-like isoform X2 n=1 Tax=Stegodyphus dumicola TaxID=202533 RepID=UPI0015AA5E52|nr:ELMO domain-containing protein 3-like isoform X2 [Stegodyphus dumicola]